MTRFTYFAFQILIFVLIGGGVFDIAWAASSATLSGSVHLQADRIEFLRDQNLVLAKGRVHVSQDQVNLYCDSLRYDLIAQELEADGHVIFQQTGQEIEANQMTYNLGTQEGKAKQIKTTVAPWICTGSEITIGHNKIIIKDARATTCDYALDYQHYHLQADTLTFYQDNYMTAENVVLYIGKIPVFYFPFFAITTKQVQLPFSISVGNTSYLGNYALISTSYLFNPVNYGSLYADYFSQKGIGLGIRHEIALNDYSVLSLYGYRIQEKDTGLVRWESRIRGLWAISSNIQGRIEADLPGDGLFSQDYAAARRDPSLVSTQREYDLSATYSQTSFTLGVLLTNQAIANFNDPLEQHFLENLISVPQINFTLFPQALIGRNWLKYDLTLNADHTWTQANNFYVTHASGEFGISQTIAFLQTQSFYSRIALDDLYQDTSDIGTNDAGQTKSYSVNGIYTGRWSDFFDTTISYNYAQKLNNIQSTDPPEGVTSNLLTGMAEFTSGSFFLAQTSTSIDFTAQVADLASRFSYLHEQISITPSSSLDFWDTIDYSIQANALKDLSSNLTLQSPKSFWDFQIGVNVVDPNVNNTGYVSTGIPKTFDISSKVDFAFFTNYRLSLLENYDMTNAQMLTRSISVYRDLHDWEAQLSYTENQGQPAAVFFTLNLKAFPGRPLTVSQSELTQLNSLQSQTTTQLFETTSDQFR